MTALTVKRGDILLVVYPFTDLSAKAVRPALVLSNDQHNASDPDLVCLMISSQAHKARPADFVLRATDPDFRQSGLRLDSVFRISRLATLETALAQRRLGTASDRVLSEVSKRLVELLGLAEITAA